MRSWVIGGSLFLALEQLDAIRELLEKRSPVQARMALILLDGLTDAMLFRRLEELYEASEMPWIRHEMPRYSTRKRSPARQRFSRRVEMARRVTAVDRLLGDGEQLIDDADAAVLKIGHSYRNDAYHEDAHNESVVASIACVLFAAVARLVARMQPASRALGHISSKQIEQLAAWGYQTDAMLELREAADQVTAAFIGKLSVDPKELRDLLAEDLDYRVDELRGDVSFLHEANIPPEKFIESVELWAHYGADEELLELKGQFDPLAMAKEAGVAEPSEEMIARSQAALKRYRERQAELEQKHRQRVSLDLIDQATRVAARLRRLSSTSQILSTYHALDVRLSELEGYVEEAVVSLDREIQHQIDLARGK
jgi:hypothetical protein